MPADTCYRKLYFDRSTPWKKAILPATPLQAWILRPGIVAVELMKQYVARTMTESCIGGLGGFGGLFELDLHRHGAARAGLRHRRRGHQAAASPCCWTSTTPSASTAWPCASTTSSAAAPSRWFFLDYIACGKNDPGEDCRHRQGRGRGLRAGRLLPSSAARPPSMPGIMPGGRVRPGRLHRGRGGQEQDPGQLDHAARAMSSSPCPPAACTPTASPWCARFSTWSTPTCWTAIMTSWASTLGEALLAPTKIYVKPVLAC